MKCVMPTVGLGIHPCIWPYSISASPVPSSEWDEILTNCVCLCGTFLKSFFYSSDISNAHTSSIEWDAMHYQLSQTSITGRLLATSARSFRIAFVCVCVWSRCVCVRWHCWARRQEDKCWPEGIIPWQCIARTLELILILLSVHSSMVRCEPSPWVRLGVKRCKGPAEDTYNE